jgi:glyoxylase-like metal-dependent hydrolase (beta-lactamase superfamily II)
MFTADVAPGIHRIEDAYTNWYLIDDGSRFTIVDAGVPTSWGSLTSALERLGRGLEDVEALVLTHGHFDHLGFAERARAQLGIPIFIHANDVPLTRHPWRYDHERSRSRYLATQFKALPIVAALTASRAWFPPQVKEVRRFTGGTLPVPGRPEVLFSPGHTHGHCALHLPDRDTVIAGDAIVTLDPYTARRGPCIVAGAATVDSERNLECLDVIAATGAGTVLTGHGDPWRDGAGSAVEHARAAGPA